MNRDINPILKLLTFFIILNNTNEESREKITTKDRAAIVIKEIPYQINKSVLNERIADLSRQKKIEGVSDIRDESNRDGIRVVIDLRRGVEAETIRRQLYKLTNIESSFGFNTLAIVDNKPKILNLKEFISEFLKFREDTVIKRVKYDLKKAEQRAHILIGLASAVENIDQVIKEKFGEKVLIKKFEKQKGFLARKFSSSYEVSFENILLEIEEKSLWQKYGL